jgi:large subunit ribosomal protein L13Ae
LNGQRVVLVRTEDLNISGSLFRNRLKFSYWLKIACNIQPAKGPYHFRSPARMVFRSIRGMIPHKTARGAAALERLKVFEGCPHPYDRMKKQVMPEALRNLHLKPNRKFCRLGDLSASVGWTKDQLIKRLEDKRRVKAAAYYQTKKQLVKVTDTAKKAVSKDLGAVDAKLAKLGY